MITLYGHGSGPNPWKVAMVLEELGLEYEIKFLDFNKGEHKAPEFTKYNPNGRVPCIIDHANNDFVLWESIAIIEYVADRYDKDNKISFSPGSSEAYLVKQWLAFQASGQGPYFGQAAWFSFFHAEKIPSAVERYQKEVERVIGVLDGVLANQKYLVGDKATIADMSFVPWNAGADFLVGSSDIDLKKYTHYQKWHADITSRPAIKKVLEEKAKHTSH